MFIPGYATLGLLFIKIFWCIIHKHQVFHLDVSGEASLNDLPGKIFC